MAAPNVRPPFRTRPVQRAKADENANSRHARQLSGLANNAGPARFVPKELLTGKSRTALSEVALNRKETLVVAGNDKPETGFKRPSNDKPENSFKRLRSNSSTLPPQRVPLGPGRGIVHVTIVNHVGPSRIPAGRAVRPSVATSKRPLRVAPPRVAATELVQEQLRETEDNMIDIDTEDEDFKLSEFDDAMAISEAEVDELDDEDDEDEGTATGPKVVRVWPDITPERALQYEKEVEAIRQAFQDDVDIYDTTMVSEYADEIFEYMNDLEARAFFNRIESMMPGADYMDHQNEITWAMRQTLVDWLLQVHLRYHMLPETLWIAVNIIDRFLTHRTVSLVKLQLVGVTAMFIAAKYEEILAPSVEEFVYMTENGYNKEEILKGERIMLQTLEFRISQYCSPYSWMRKISKADDYDIQTRTLSKFLTEVTLLDYRFVRVKPSLIAAVGMYCARRMLDGNWDDAFVFHSGYTEEQLLPGHEMLIEKLAERNFSRQYVCKKYSHKKFLKASAFAVDWAKAQVSGNGNPVERMLLEE
ncbi:Cyclin N-terminal domain-containing protein [Mycena indigotica]|uniref:Cyclin N-terminal domain-containing protein n=1 Tax=Mycena indigotica TaxID=2126181 RepID=A0A8H6T7R0_9AGAR|nr:Cyclin N-terminal domain-containing protein [Mycena indigotica]KAF7312334.1 Cyclin N-terminal domain-containing protein [Mycena indigotica]